MKHEYLWVMNSNKGDNGKKNITTSAFHSFHIFNTGRYVHTVVFKQGDTKEHNQSQRAYDVCHWALATTVSSIPLIITMAHKTTLFILGRKLHK